MNLEALRLRCTPILLGIAVSLNCAVSYAADNNTILPPAKNSPDLAEVIQKWVNEMDVVYAETTIEANDTTASILERLGIRDSAFRQYLNSVRSTSVKAVPIKTKAKAGKGKKAHKSQSYKTVKVSKDIFGRLIPGRLVQAKLTPKGDVISIRMYNELDTMNPETAFFEVAKDESANTNYRHGTNKAPVDLVPVAISGVIKESLSQAASDVGIPQNIEKQLELQLAQFDIKKMRSGDTFTVLFEKREHEGTDLGTGRLLAFEYYSSGKKKAEAFWFDNGQVQGYFRADGTSAGKTFMIPCKAILTSAFNRMRRHPVTGKLKPHWGVDLAAPFGTPIYAASEGTIYKKTFQRRGYGNFIEIDHGDGYTTLYAHMSKFVAGIEEGMAVRKGQLIGFVGRTGMATGPHLHYELRKNGNQVNPLIASGSAGQGLGHADLKAFQVAIAPLRNQVALAGKVQVAYNTRAK